MMTADTVSGRVFVTRDVGPRAVLRDVLQQQYNRFSAETLTRHIMFELGGEENLRCTRRCVYKAVSKTTRLLTRAGCLVADKVPGQKSPMVYSFSDAALNILTEPANEVRATDELASVLLTKFNVADESHIINGRPPSKFRRELSVKTPGTTPDATAMRQLAAAAKVVRCVMPDGTTFYGHPDAVGAAVRQARNAGEQTLSPKIKPVSSLDFRTTLSAVLLEQAAGMRATLFKLQKAATEEGSVVSLRYLALALSQWDHALAGLKYAVAYHFSLATNAQPCNAEDAALVALSSDVVSDIDAYLKQLETVAEKLPTADSGKPISLPTLHAPHKSGDGFAEMPCAFREPHLVQWHAQGQVLPDALLERVARRRSKKKTNKAGTA